jgi:predicted transcriptional regulator
MNDLAKLKTRLLQDPATREQYDAQAPEFAIARELIAARTRAGLSQAEVAARMGTSQSSIARLESGHMLPSLRTLDRFARATGSRAVVRLEADSQH